MINSPIDRVSFKRNCSMLAVALWIASTVAMFLFDKESKWLWLPDSLLLCGFWPLLYYQRSSWPWLLFGVTNLIIAVEILMLPFLPQTAFPALMLPLRQHLVEHHLMGPWLLLGLVSIFYGIVRAAKNLFLWLTRT